MTSKSFPPFFIPWIAVDQAVHSTTFFRIFQIFEVLAWTSGVVLPEGSSDCILGEVVDEESLGKGLRVAKSRNRRCFE
jgi:hypothetical protein